MTDKLDKPLEIEKDKPLEMYTISSGSFTAAERWEPTCILRHAKVVKDVEGVGEQQVTTYKVVIQQMWHERASHKRVWRELPFADLSDLPLADEYPFQQ